MEIIILYSQLVDHLEAAVNEDNEINDDLYKFRVCIGHQGPLKATDPNWEGYKYNVLTGEKTYETLSVLAADDPVTCATYAKENDLLHIDGWNRFWKLAKRDKILIRAVIRSKIRQTRRSNKYMFGYLIPKSYKEGLEFDKGNNNTKWADAVRDEMDCIKEQEVFTTCQRSKPQMNPKCMSQPPKDQGKLDICCQFQWETHGKTCGRWISHSKPHGEHLLRSAVPETLKTCHIA